MVRPMLETFLVYIDTIIYILLPAVLAAFVVFFLYARKLAASHSARRGEEMRMLAMRINFDYSAADEINLKRVLETNDTFFPGSDGAVECVVRGEKNGLEVALFDYTQSPTQKESITICLLRIPYSVPPFEMQPLEDSHIASGKTVELGDKLLTHKYRIECDDKTFVDKRFGSDMEDFLSRRRRTTVLASGTHLVFHRGKALSVKRCYSLLDFAFGFYMKMDLEGMTEPEPARQDQDEESKFEIKSDLYND